MREVLCRDGNNVQPENKAQKVYKYFLLILNPIFYAYCSNKMAFFLRFNNSYK